MSEPLCNRNVFCIRGKSEEHNLGHRGAFWEVETAEQDSEG